MNLKRFCTRFREMRTCYVGTKVSFLDKIFYAVDYVFAFIIHGASISDYFAYGFYKLRYKGRKSMYPEDVPTCNKTHAPLCS